MVKFRKSFRSYVTGDVAGFSKQHEAWLIKKNIAEKHEKEGTVGKSAGDEKKEGPPPAKDKQTTVGPQTRK